MEIAHLVSVDLHHRHVDLPLRQIQRNVLQKRLELFQVELAALVLIGLDSTSTRHGFELS
eukprot:2822025-Rhodomonas_salina.2